MANHRDNARQPEEMRLQKFLSMAGVASRRHAEELIDQGRVKISGRVVTEKGVLVTPGKSRVEVDNKPVFYSPERNYILFHKPAECVTTLDDPEGRTTVIDLLPRSMPRVFPVGRLDWDTEGLLLLTNDGELAYRLMHPGSNVPRVYHAKVRGELKDTAPEFKKLQKGVELEDGFARPDRVAILKFTGNNTWIEIELHIGRNRIVRRMFDAVGFPVMKLRRVSFGELTLDGLSLGAFRDLSEREVQNLYTMLGDDTLNMPAVRTHQGVRYAPGFKPGERMPRQSAPSRSTIEEQRRESGRVDRRPRPARNPRAGYEDAERPSASARSRHDDSHYKNDESRAFKSAWDRRDERKPRFSGDDRRDDRKPRFSGEDRRDDRKPRFSGDDRRDDRKPRFSGDDRRDDRKPRFSGEDRRDDRKPRFSGEERRDGRKPRFGASDDRVSKTPSDSKKRMFPKSGRPNRGGHDKRR